MKSAGTVCLRKIVPSLLNDERLPKIHTKTDNRSDTHKLTRKRLNLVRRLLFLIMTQIVRPFLIAPKINKMTTSAVITTLEAVVVGLTPVKQGSASQKID